MSATSDLLFEYLREIFYATPDAKLDLDKIEDDYIMFAKGLMYFAQCFSQYNEFAKALGKGDLSVEPPPPENELAAPLKSLHASLKHLAWQSLQVAKGDYKQNVDFMGEFSKGFNMMVEQLADRQQKLEDEISQSNKHADALEQSNLLLSTLTDYIPQQIFVVDIETNEVLLSNDLAMHELDNDAGYIDKLMKRLPDRSIQSGNFYIDVQFHQENMVRYLAVNAYLIEWNMQHAVALVIKDVSAEKRQLMELEDHAYRDSLTHVYNRFYGMMTLDDLIAEKARFSLIFADLDSLKYINDKHGHSDGDEYIIRVSRHLQAFSQDATVCRLGGDEFMLLISDMSQDEASSRMDEISYAIEHDDYLSGKDYSYSISIGIVAVDESNTLSSSAVLSIADERMYEHKRARKKERQAKRDN